VAPQKRAQVGSERSTPRRSVKKPTPGSAPTGKPTKLSRGDAQELIAAQAKRVKPEDVQEVIRKADELESKFKSAGPLNKFLQDFYLLLSLVRDWSKRRYPHVPFWTITAIVVALLYVMNPLDLIPDFIPGVGYVDDATLIAACLALVKTDINQYRRWRERGGAL